jgi:hypothetical protein
MAYKLSKREGFLVAVLIVAGGLALFYGSGGRIFSPSEEPAELALLGEPPLIQIDRLARGAESFDPKARNLFQYSAPPRPAAPPPPPTPPPKREPPRVRKPPPSRQQQQAQTAELQPPKIKFEFIGVLGPKDAKIAVFEQPGEEEILLARAGEVVERKFRLLEFKYEAVVMGYTDERFKDKTTELIQKR